MSTEPASSRWFLSGARLAGLRFGLPCDPDRLRAHLAALGLAPALAEGDGLPRVWCELWHVSDGRLELGGVDQHGWSSMVGTMVGAWWGAWAGLPRGAPLATAAAGARSGARRAVELSQVHSMLLGHYRELFLGVPCTRPGTAGEEAMLVLGMRTDSPFARWADGAWGYGFGKQWGRFEVPSLRAWEVFTAAGAEVLRAEAEEEEALLGAAEPLVATWARPLLGVVEGGRLARSSLVRRIEPERTRVAGIRGCVEVSAGLHPLVPPGRYPIEPATSGPTAASFRGVHARIGYPRRL